MIAMTLYHEVQALMEQVADCAILPRFKRLSGSDVAEKSPGEVVTSADLEAERLLAAGLANLCPGARIVGEEAVSADPGLLSGVGDGLVWLVDPLDGTANFAAGKALFGMMIALVDNGVPQMGWILDVVTGRMCFAEAGKGATIDGERVRARTSGSTRPVAALGTQFLEPYRRERVHAHAFGKLQRVSIPRCAAESYPRLVLGENDIALFQRSLPWDHAAGALFVNEAGGHVTHWDRSPYRVGGSGTGILAAADPYHWEVGAEVLLSPEAGLVMVEELVR